MTGANGYGDLASGIRVFAKSARRLLAQLSRAEECADGLVLYADQLEQRAGSLGTASSARPRGLRELDRKDKQALQACARSTRLRARTLGNGYAELLVDDTMLLLPPALAALVQELLAAPPGEFIRMTALAKRLSISTHAARNRLSRLRRALLNNDPPLNPECIGIHAERGVRLLSAAEAPGTQITAIPTIERSA